MKTKAHGCILSPYHLMSVIIPFCVLIMIPGIMGCGAQAIASEPGESLISPAQQIGTYVLMTIVHVLIVGTVLLMICIAFNVVASESNDLERVILGASLSAGFLIYVAARSLGISIPSMMALSLSTANPFGIVAMVLLFPSACGIAVSWFCLRLMKQDEDVAKRMALLLTTLMITMFSDVYVALVPEIGFSNGKFALPNVTFVLGMTLYMMFTYHHQES